MDALLCTPRYHVLLLGTNISSKLLGPSDQSRLPNPHFAHERALAEPGPLCMPSLCSTTGRALGRQKMLGSIPSISSGR